MKTFFLTLIGLITTILLYFVWITDKIICILSTNPQVGFKVWMHKANAYNHNLQVQSFIRVVLFIGISLIYTMIW